MLVPQNDFEILHKSILNPVQQLIVAEVAPSSRIPTVALELSRHGGLLFPVDIIAFDAMKDEPLQLFQTCRDLSSDRLGSKATVVLVLTDATPDGARTKTAAGFWHGMNQLREGWNSLPAQIVFLLSATQYLLFTTEADHFRRWVGLKLHLNIADVRPMRGARRFRGDAKAIQLRSEPPAPDPETAESLTHLLRQQLEIAVTRHESSQNLVSRYYLPLLTALMNSGDLNDASIVSERIRELLNDLDISHKLEWMGLRAGLEEEQGKFESALNTREECLNLSRELGDETPEAREALWQLSFLLLRLKRYEEAAFHSRIGLKHYGDGPIGASWALLAALVQENRKDYDEAERMYRLALDFQPENSLLLSGLADFLGGFRGEYDEAERLYRRAVEFDPENILILVAFANFLWEARHDYDEAERLYRRAVEFDPDDSISLGTFATFLGVVRHDYDEAERLYRRSLQIEPDNISIVRTFADFLQVVRSEFDEAERLYRRAIELEPDNKLNNYAYGDFLDKVRGKPDEAEQLRRRGIELESA